MYQSAGSEGSPLEDFEVPGRIPNRAIRQIRRESRIDHDLAFTNLEFVSHGLGIDTGPRFFTKEVETDRDFEKRTLLAVPLGRVVIHLRAVFVAINIETSHPELNDERHRRATAFKFDLGEKQICQYPEQTAVLEKGAARWEHDAGYGPHLSYRDGFADVTCWDGLRLELPTQTYDKLSLESLRQREMAAYLSGILGQFDRADAKNFSLLPGKL